MNLYLIEVKAKQLLSLSYGMARKAVVLADDYNEAQEFAQVLFISPGRRSIPVNLHDLKHNYPHVKITDMKLFRFND